MRSLRTFGRFAYPLIAATLVLAACGPAAQTPAAPAPAAKEAPKSSAPAQQAAPAKQSQPAAAPVPPTAPPAKPANAPNPNEAKPTPVVASSGKALQEVTVVYPVEFESRSPYGQSGGQGNAFWQHIYDPVLTWDEVSSTHIGVLATNWENPDNETWIFNLRKDAKFADGTPVTAEDVIWSFERIENDPDSKQAHTFETVESWRAIDPHTLEIKTDGVDAAFLTRIEHRVVQSKAYMEKMGLQEGDRNPMGSGPYKMLEWVPGQRVVLEKRPDWWGKSVQPSPHPTYVSGEAPVKAIYRFMKEPEARVTAAVNGEVDVITRIPPQLLARFDGNQRAEVIGVPGLRHMFFGLNPITEAMKKTEVRQAIYHAIDVEGLAEGVLKGEAFALEGPLAPFVFGYDPNLRTYPYDPAKAKELLAQAGYPNGVSIDFICPNGQYTKDKEVCEAAAAMLQQVGINPNLQFKEWGTFSSEYQDGKYEMYLIGRGSVVDPSRYLTQYFRCEDTSRLLYCNDEVDKWLDAEKQTLKAEERKAAFAKAQAALMDDPAAVFLFTYRDNYGVAKRLDWQPWSNEYIYLTRMKPAL